jgi:hypothetical protein
MIMYNVQETWSGLEIEVEPEIGLPGMQIHQSGL